MSRPEVKMNGIFKVGETITATTEPAGAALSHQWHVDSDNVPGETGDTYVIRPEDAGEKLSVRITYDDGNGGTDTARSKRVQIAG